MVALTDPEKAVLRAFLKSKRGSRKLIEPTLDAQSLQSGSAGDTRGAREVSGVQCVCYVVRLPPIDPIPEGAMNL